MCFNPSRHGDPLSYARTLRLTYRRRKHRWSAEIISAWQVHGEREAEAAVRGSRRFDHFALRTRYQPFVISFPNFSTTAAFCTTYSPSALPMGRTGVFR